MAPRESTLLSDEESFFGAAVSSVPSHLDGTASAASTEDVLTDADEMIATARSFLSKTCPSFLTTLDGHPDQKSSSDRLIKVGRNVTSTLRYDKLKKTDPSKTNASLRLLVSECETLRQILTNAHPHKVPHVRFGKTELSMPVLTLGSMRFQQTWNRDADATKHIASIDEIDAECQDNLVNILRHAINMGVNHIETAKAYGTSEIQLGAALRVLFDSGEVRREDLIVQTKGGITSTTTPQEYRDAILQQLDNLQLDYVDLFSVHGLNTNDHYDWLFHTKSSDDGTTTLMDVLRQLKGEGKIRHYGFSTHAPADVIKRFIDTDEFEYVNLHYHYFGSYTASGDGPHGGNLDNVRLCQRKDMGVFIISPYDKGGRLYAPSNRLRDITLPELEPMAFGSLWLWQHELHDAESAPIHTIVCGAARPSDLDQPIVAALMLESDDAARRREVVAQRLRRAAEDALGREWADTWHVGLPNCSDSRWATQHGNIVWLYNLIEAYGMVDFGKERYETMEGHLAKWDDGKSVEENVDAMGPFWQWVPGCAIDPAKDYSEDFAKCPQQNRERLLEAIRFVHGLCAKDSTEKIKGSSETETFYDMRPWTAFPERS